MEHSISTWYLTVNSNQTAETLDPQYFKTKVHELLGTNVLDYITYLKGSRKDIIKVLEWSKPEIGTVRQYIHAHILIQIHHKAKIHLDYKKIRADLEAAGLAKSGTAYLYVVPITDNLGNVLNYMRQREGLDMTFPEGEAVYAAKNKNK